MKKFLQFLVVVLVAAGVATIIVQRDRLRQIDREQLVGQVRDAIQSKMPKKAEEQGLEAAEATEQSEEAAAAPAEEGAEEASD